MSKQQRRTCFHCGTLLPQQGGIHVQVANQTQQVCCTGCQCVVESLQQAGCYVNQQTCVCHAKQGELINETD